MKLLPEPKLLLVGYVIGMVLNLPSVGNIGSFQDLILWLLVGNTVNGIFVIIVIRIVVWLGKKIGLAK